MIAAALIALGIIMVCWALGDAPPSQPDVTITHYTGPRYSRWGNVIEPEGMSCA